MYQGIPSDNKMSFFKSPLTTERQPFTSTAILAKDGCPLFNLQLRKLPLGDALRQHFEQHVLNANCALHLIG